MRKVITKWLVLLGALGSLVVAPEAVAQQNVQAQLQALRAEPTVRQVQEAALRYFRVNSDTVSSMRTRAGLKALLPVTEVSGGFSSTDSDEETLNFEVFPDSPWVNRAAGGSGYEIRGKLTWNLPQLVFNAEELDVASLAGLMEGLLKESTRLYFMRRRLQVDMILTPPTDQASLLSKDLRLQELTGLLDAMTGGWFQQALSAQGARSSQAPAPGATPHQAPLDAPVNLDEEPTAAQNVSPPSVLRHASPPTVPSQPVVQSD